MATNIYNSKTGQSGYQVPGAALQPGWQWSGGTPPPAPAATNTNYNTPASTPYVSDSSSIITGENNTINSFKGLLANTTTMNNTVSNYGASADALANYQSLLEARRQEQTKQITDQFNQLQTDTEQKQKSEVGSTNAAITRLGGYLGGSGSGSGVMTNLAVTHQAELQKLATQRAAAIQAANNAIDDKEFQLAQEKVKEAKDAEAQIYQRQQDFFNNALKLQGEFRSEQDQQAQNVKDLLDRWQYVSDPTTINTADKAKVDSIYGSGFTDNYIKTTNDAKKAQASKDSIGAMQSYINLIESVPAGMKIPLGDETITGIGKTSDISTFQVQDKDGNVRIINYNKANGQYGITNLGGIGKATDTGGGAGTAGERAASAISKYQNYFVPGTTNPKTGTPVFDSDGHMTAQAWKDAVNSAPSEGLSRGDFISQFGHLLLNENGEVSASYGLTPVEKKLITGVIQ